MRVARCHRVKGLRRVGVEQRIDRIGERSLHSSVSLEAEPGHVLPVDIVIDASRLYLLAIITRMRNALAARATISVGGRAARDGPVTIKRTAQNRERGSRGVAVKRKELLVERYELGRWLIGRSGYR